MVVHDGASYHKAAATTAFVAQHAERLSVHPLPAYSPDYNPIEHLWRNVKRDKTHNRYFPTFEALVQAVEKGMTGFQQDPAAVRQLMGPYLEETAHCALAAWQNHYLKNYSTSSTPSPEVLAQAGRALGLGEDAGDTWPYFVHEGGLWMHQQHSDGSAKPPLLLGNFVAQITAETTPDDGERQEELYAITATCAGRRGSIELRRTEFESETAVARIVAALGARARVNPRAQPRFVLDAIKALSSDVREDVMHTHTGWVRRRFLFANGYVDTAGWHEAPGCQLPRRLQQYRLSPPTATLPEALDVFDSLLAIAPAGVMVPLVAGVLLGPILASLDAPAPMVHLYGPTGSHKTSVTCAALALFGDFTPNQPTDTWTSTANSIQRLGWHLKDVPMLLDDYKAANVKPQQVTFLLQNYGDNMARGRLDSK
jgi:hypothetical protein